MLVNYNHYRPLYDTVAECVSHLRYLNLGRTAISDSILSQILQKSPNLNSLWLEENFEITDASVLDLSTHCPHLHTIKFRNCTNVSDKSLVPLIQGLKGQLTVLGISYTRATSETLEALACYGTGLEFLLMNDIQVDDEEVLHSCIPKLGKSMRHLTMSGWSIVSDRTLQLIARHCRSLERLDISYCGDEGSLTEDGLTQLGSLWPRLKVLVISGIDNLSPGFVQKLEKRFDTDQFWLEAPLK